MKLLDDWQKEIVRPILVNVSTAGILFSIALVFQETIADAFSKRIEEYPLICAFEPYKAASDQALNVDVFIINKAGEDHTSQTLAETLKLFRPDDLLSLSPEIRLEVADNYEILDAKPDVEFNSQKGKASVDVISQGGAQFVLIHVGEIRKRAILKVLVLAKPPRTLGEVTRDEFVRRTPFRDYERLQDGCYS